MVTKTDELFESRLADLDEALAVLVPPSPGLREVKVRDPLPEWPLIAPDSPPVSAPDRANTVPAFRALLASQSAPAAARIDGARRDIGGSARILELNLGNVSGRTIRLAITIEY